MRQSVAQLKDSAAAAELRRAEPMRKQAADLEKSLAGVAGDLKPGGGESVSEGNQDD